MTHYFQKAALLLTLTLTALLQSGIAPVYSGEMSGKSIGKMIQDSRKKEPWETRSVDLSVGYLFKITNVTPLDYEVMSMVMSFKLPLMRKWQFAGGDLILRTRIDLIADYIVKGAENHYFGFSGSPSFEWWNQPRNFSLFLAVGGGVGAVDSTNAVVGGQGQDFTFNWFAHLGARHRIKENLMFHYGVFFHHLSNRGMDSINPGLNTLGPMIGLTYEF